MLYLVATPIGNLQDLTLRALDTLRTVDVIACEDTRHTRKLLTHYSISKPLVSFHEHNEHRAGQAIIRTLREGRNVALVTDAGTPGISDPGFSLVRTALTEGLPLTVIPGPTALIAALVLSGLPVHAFTFRGFPPRKRGPRRRFLAMDRDSPHTLIFYESPYRLIGCLQDALEVYGDRSAAVANDLTKMFERVYRGTLSGLLAELERERQRGEYCVIIGGANHEQSNPASEPRNGEPQ